MFTEIHTEFYSNEFNHLLTKFYKYMADGRCGSRVSKNADYAKVEHDPNGETVIRVHGGSRTVYAKKHSIAEILDWLGWMLKCQVHDRLERDGYSKKAEWRRDNFSIPVPFLHSADHPVYVGDIYYIYDALKNRKNIDKKYDKKVVNKWRGKQNDPIVTEAERARREEVVKIETEYAEKIKNCDYDSYKYNWGTQTDAKHEMKVKYDQLQDEFNQKVKQLEEEVGGKWKREAERLRKEKEEKIKELNETMGVLQMLGI